MLINSYNFGRPAGANIAYLVQNTEMFVMNNGSGNTDNFTMLGVKQGSTILVVVHHMMLNGNADTSIVSDNVHVSGYPQQAKSTCGSLGGSNHKGSVQIHRSTPIDFGGPASGDVKIFVKSNDANIANIRMQYIGLEVTNLANANIATTDFVAVNTGTSNLGNTTPNIAIPSGWSNPNTFMIAAVTGLTGSFNVCSYPPSLDGGAGAAWSPLWIKYETTDTSTANTRSMTNYQIGTSNASQIIADWGTAHATTPWAALITAFPTT